MNKILSAENNPAYDDKPKPIDVDVDSVILNMILLLRAKEENLEAFIGGRNSNGSSDYRLISRIARQIYINVERLSDMEHLLTMIAEFLRRVTGKVIHPFVARTVFALVCKERNVVEEHIQNSNGSMLSKLASYVWTTPTVIHVNLTEFMRHVLHISEFGLPSKYFAKPGTP